MPRTVRSSNNARPESSDLDQALAFIAGGSGGLEGPWTIVTHAQSPFTPTAAQRALLIDETGGVVQVNLPPITVDGQTLTLNDFKGLSGGQPIIIQGGAGVTMEDPSNPGGPLVNQGRIASGGAVVTLKALRGTNQWFLR